MLVDTHCHLEKQFFDDIDLVLKRACDSGINRVISSADSLLSCYEMLDLSEKYSQVYITLGIHPENCFDNLDELEQLIKQNVSNRKLVAIGEIGLDYHYGKENKDRQIETFEFQLALAEENRLPVVVHSRDATIDTINTLKKYNLKGVIHCFSGSFETALQYIDMGFYIGIGGVLTFKNAKLKDVVGRLPIEKLVLETDSPFLAPTPFRGSVNEPKNIKIICEYLANIKHMNYQEIEKIINQNVKDVFDI